jgi:hypothetical protein
MGAAAMLIVSFGGGGGGFAGGGAGGGAGGFFANIEHPASANAIADRQIRRKRCSFKAMLPK